MFDRETFKNPATVRQVGTRNEGNICVPGPQVKVFSEVSEECLASQDFCNIRGFILWLLGSTAPLRRVFSVVHSVRSKEKPR